MGLYLALLRGINVGGKNLIKMADLKACFADHGFSDVGTFIQSGNVVFRASRAARTELTRAIEAMLAAAFRYRATVVLRSHKQLEATVAGAPRGFGAQPSTHRYDVIFLKEPLTAALAMGSVKIKDGVDEAHAGPGALYFRRLISRASQSQLIRLASLPVYQSMTVRNWNTTQALLAMMRASSG